MPLLVYTATALLILWLAHRFIVPLSRGAAAFLFFLPFLFVGHALIANRVFAPIDKIYMDVPLSVVKERYGIGEPHNPATADIFSQMIPWRHAVRESVLRGEWPLWNPYILSGDILAAAAQPAVYSPFTWLALLMPAPLSFTFTAAITFLIAALGAFLLARDLGCRERAASVAAAGFMCACGTTLYILWPLGLSWALFPLVLLGARRVVDAPSVQSWALLTTAFVLLLNAGHPESVLHIVVLGAAYGFVEWLAHRSLRAIGVAFAAGIVSLLVCAIFLLPYFEALPQTGEYFFRQLWKGSDRSAKTTQVLLTLATDAFPDLHLRKWTKPDIGGLAGETAAVGSIILALAIYAAWRVRSRTTWFFTIATLIALAAHAGWKPVARVIHALPGFDITLNDRLAFGVSCMLAILAAIGVEHLQRRSAAITMAIVLAFLSFGSWWIARTYVIERGPRDWGEHTTLAELLFLGIALLALSWWKTGNPACPDRQDCLSSTRLPFVLLACLIAQRGISEYNVHASFPQKAAYPEMQLFAPLKNIREPFRVTGTHWALLPATNALYGLEDVRGYEAMTFHPYVKTWELWSTHQPVFFNRTDDLSKPFLSMMNVRFAFTREDAPVPPGWREVAREGAAVLLENERVLPRAFVPRHVSIGLQSEVAVDQMAGVTDFHERAWITADVVPYERNNGPGTVTQRGNTLQADMQGDGWIVVTNSAWQGWRAYVDGKRVKLQRANVAFLGIHVPAGQHTIRLVYLPESFVTGRAISAITLIAIALFHVARASARRSRRSARRRRRSG
ncbi:MAG TPA: YfhO family protein [Thermoanaerobaculia bacterium]